MVPTHFYGVDASVLYEEGISFLIKKYNGEDTDGTGENKSVDFHLDLLLTFITVNNNEEDSFAECSSSN